MDRTSRRIRALRAPRLRPSTAALVAIAALVFAACNASGSATQAPNASPSASAAAAGYTVTSVQDPKLGAFLAGEDAKTLYVFTKDAGGKSVCSGDCAAKWPPFVLDAGETVTAGTGVTGTFGTITRDDGKTQVTYQGAPLYYFAADTKAGDVNGQGIGGVWFVAATGGGPGGASPAPSTPPASPTAAPSAGASGATGGIYDFGFEPTNLTVAVGTTVTWTNTGQRQHTVTADDSSFTSGSLASGQTFSQTFTKAGTYAYHCAVHPDMKATVIVQ